MGDQEGGIREQVERCLLAYTRGIDRLDSDLVRSAFHPDAVIEGYGPEPSTIESFLERAISGLRAGFRATQHRLSNTKIETHRDCVVVESYVLAFHVQEDNDSSQRLLTFGGRYVDRFSERDGAWRIARRQLLYDWSRIEDIEGTVPGAWMHGARDRSDPIYQSDCGPGGNTDID